MREAIAGPYLGLFNLSNNGLPTNHILAVELHTVQSPEFKDINGNHVGVDMNSLKSNESTAASRATVVVLITIGVAVYIVRKKKYEEVNEDWEKEYGPHRISYKILYKTTKGFKDKELIGQGDFGKRFQIIRVAYGLLYLHEEWEQIVLRIDIKPANVLLDVDLNGKLGDFGLARLYDQGSDPQTTNLVGTIGYLALELFKTGKATTSTDVFAFGAFMLEVACERRPMAMEPSKKDLADWVTDFLKRGAIIDASDPRLEGIYIEEQMELVLKLGIYCSDSNP
ncbi:L-type lectin-domain containing receptor kinase IV.1-like [Pistacia vera]|uniref:L-type lectin-domain containing receptor kinase IV.1-like n=1 Tax=Pistacia vera TaxID=55513 RepID=UPI0012632513|nr:L-type lectin-domain containing receptor kinase IV.1-like [Pistacia vera]